MSVTSLSFYQQNANYWNRSQAETQSLAASDSLITAMGNVMTNQAAGMASIANQEALTRVQNQLAAQLKSAIQTASNGSNSSGSSASTSSAPRLATGTGTVPLLATTSLITLGIPAASGISVSDGTNTTTYTTTGTDTVGDLINALNNTTKSGNAQINAYLNSTGNLVISATQPTGSLSVSGLFAQNIGFGPKNSSFAPAPAVSSTSTSSAASSSSTAASSPSTGSTTNTQPTLFNSAYALQTANTAATLLGNSIDSTSSSIGSTVNLFA
jgi:hypothetical protein